MTRTRVLAALALVAGAVPAAFAQDQTIVVGSPPFVCEAVGDASSASLTPANAPAMIAQSLGIARPADGTPAAQPSRSSR